MASLNKLKEKYNRWLECFSGEDPHSVQRQIISMLNDTAVYRMINELRKTAPKDRDGNHKLNYPIHRWINVAFFRGQSLAIRKFCDKHPLYGGTSVFSLEALLHDIIQNLHCLTRKNIFAIKELPYDSKKYAEKEEQIVRGYTENDVGRLAQEYHKRGRADRLHKYFDLLAGVTEDTRTAQDTIPTDVFDALQTKLRSTCKRFCDHADKRIAHAAAPNSREMVDLDVPTWGQLEAAQKIICQLAIFLGEYLLEPIGSFFAVAQYDRFAYLEQPLGGTATRDAAEKLWDDYEAEVKSWRDTDLFGDIIKPP